MPMTAPGRSRRLHELGFVAGLDSRVVAAPPLADPCCSSRPARVAAAPPAGVVKRCRHPRPRGSRRYRHIGPSSRLPLHRGSSGTATIPIPVVRRATPAVVAGVATSPPALPTWPGGSAGTATIPTAWAVTAIPVSCGSTKSNPTVTVRERHRHPGVAGLRSRSPPRPSRSLRPRRRAGTAIHPDSVLTAAHTALCRRHRDDPARLWPPRAPDRRGRRDIDTRATVKVTSARPSSPARSDPGPGRHGRGYPRVVVGTVRSRPDDRCDRPVAVVAVLPRSRPRRSAPAGTPPSPRLSPGTVTIPGPASRRLRLLRGHWGVTIRPRWSRPPRHPA